MALVLTICHSLRCTCVVAAMTLMLPPLSRNWSYSQYNSMNELYSAIEVPPRPLAIPTPPPRGGGGASL